MTNMATGYLDFLEGLYGRAAIDQIMKASGLDRTQVEKASEAFAPAFLDHLLDARNKSMQSFGVGKGPTDLTKFWPPEIADVMQRLLKDTAKAAQSMAGSKKGADASAFPFNLYTDQIETMQKLNQVFMGQVAQARLMEDVTKATGISTDQLQMLFPMLTTYGLLPLMPQMSTPAMDDPAGWLDYLGTMGRKTFQQANRDIGAMPNPLHAAFEGLMSGLYPKITASEQPAPSLEADKAQEVRDATLELQANYLKGLNSLFEHYASGIENGQKSKTK